MPSKFSVILRQYLSAPPFEYRFPNCSHVGKLNFLKKSMQCNISYETHQISKICKDPHHTHGAAIKHLITYLRGTCDDRLVLDPNRSKSIKVNDDADFYGK